MESVKLQKTRYSNRSSKARTFIIGVFEVIARLGVQLDKFRVCLLKGSVVESTEQCRDA